MKRALLLLCLIFTTVYTSFSQETYTFGNETLTLNKEVDGPISLLWTTENDTYRYFLQKDAFITELKNEKVDGVYTEEYKDVLQKATDDGNVSTEDLKLTLPSLREFFNTYNSQVSTEFVASDPGVAVTWRLGPLAGITNSIFSENPDNIYLPTVGFELELLEEENLRRHALVFRFEHVFENEEYKFSATQASLNYRFKFIKSDAIDVYANGKFVAYTYSTKEITYLDPDTLDDEPAVLITEEVSGGDFNSPATFGIGADIKLAKGYLFFTYNDIVGLGVDSNGEFPVDFTLGYKFTL
ncbi:hypothetical protein [Luteirhabdus pelagi]|uniref:hypothetical protein n=1 Tax=Luteirhabdus pelagi TaxID=2792783 RepID=UPI00193AA117|nr:hypothetical protein [Luteirhabdus pelagi]